MRLSSLLFIGLQWLTLAQRCNCEYPVILQFSPWELEEKRQRMESFADLKIYPSNGSLPVATYCWRFQVFSTKQQCLLRDKINDVEIHLGNFRDNFAIIKGVGSDVLLLDINLFPFEMRHWCVTFEITGDDSLNVKVQDVHLRNTLLFREGVYYNSTAHAGFIFTNTTKQLRMGNCLDRKYNSRKLFHGEIADVMIYPRSLHPDEGDLMDFSCVNLNFRHPDNIFDWDELAVPDDATNYTAGNQQFRKELSFRFTN